MQILAVAEMVDEPVVVDNRDLLAVLTQGRDAEHPLALGTIAARRRSAAKLCPQPEPGTREQRRGRRRVDPEHKAELPMRQPSSSRSASASR